MPCATPYGTSPPQFGIPSEELSLLTQSVKVALKADEKEVRNGCGNVVHAVHYNLMNEVDISGYGTLAAGANFIGEVITLANAALFPEMLVGAIHISEIDSTLSNEDYILVNVKGKAWDAIAT